MADSDKKHNDRSLRHSEQAKVTTEMMAACCKRVVHFLKTEKSFTRPAYSLWELAHESGMTARLVSKSINEYMGQNFFVLINRMRVEEAKRLLHEAAKSGEKISLEEVGIKSGFRSRGAFFARFREYEGITPGKYLTLNKEEDTI